MKRDDLTAALRRVNVANNFREIWSPVCLGCGHECGCSIHGCRILLDAAELLEYDAQRMQSLQRDVYGLRRLLREE